MPGLNKGMVLSPVVVLLWALAVDSGRSWCSGANAAHGNWKEICRIEGSGSIHFLAISPAGKTLAYCETIFPDKIQGQSRFVLLDLVAGKELKRSPWTTGSTGAAVFSPNGKLLALGSRTRDGKPCLWDVEQWKEHRALDLLENHRFGLPFGFSSEGKQIVGRSGLASDQEEIVTWDVTTGKCHSHGKYDFTVPIARGGLPPYSSLEWRKVYCFAEDGSPFLFISGGASTTVFDIERAEALQTLPGYRNWYRGCRITPGGRLLVLPSYEPELPIAAIPDEQKRDKSIVIVATPGGDKPWWPLRVGERHTLELHRFEDFKGGKHTRRFALSPDGKRLVAVGITPQNEDKDFPPSTLIVWDVSALHTVAAKNTSLPTPQELQQLWARLIEGDHEFNAHQAMFSLVANPKEATGFLAKHLGPPRDFKRVPQCIQDLDSDDFKTRVQASRELERLGHLAEGPLKEALKKNPSADKKKWLEDLLAKIQPTTAAAYELRLLRIIDVLEHIATAEARELLQAIAGGGYGPAFAAPAKEALERAAKKKPKD